MSKTLNKNRFFLRLTACVLFAVIISCSLAVFAGCQSEPTNDISGVIQTETIDPSPNDTESFSETFGRINEYSTFAKGELLYDTFYYSDEWFFEDPAERNDALALLSMQLSAAAIEDDQDGAGAKALRALGFRGVKFEGFKTADADDCAYTQAIKYVGGKKIVAVIFQSYAFDKETKIKGWKQNFCVNGDAAGGEHFAFKKAAEKAVEKIAAEGGENTLFWITGHSRGGAIANLTAAKLYDRIENGDGVLAYTFEAPATKEASSDISAGKDYPFIHNYLSMDDIVTLLPMWGMTLYGNIYELKSEETENSLYEELEKICSKAVGFEYYSKENMIRYVAEYLEERLAFGAAEREDYSALREDEYVDDDGERATVVYTYQNTMQALMGVIFSGELSAIIVDDLGENLPMFSSAVYALADAVKGEAQGDAIAVATDYYKAAKGLREVVCDLLPTGSISLSDDDVYALLRLVGPLMLDVDYEPEGDAAKDVPGYIYPTVDLAQSFESLSFAHNFDVVIARLKALAPKPQAGSFDVATEAVEAGDGADALPRSFANGVAAAGIPWVTVADCSWQTADSSLENDTVYYFSAKIEIAGHNVSEDFFVSINGKQPIDVSGGYEKGVYVGYVLWEYVFGMPKKVNVSFETEHGFKPDTEKADKGKILKYSKEPDMENEVCEDGKSYIFGCWQSEDGTPWNDIMAAKDVTVYAHWIEVIDKVDIYFDIPTTGDEVSSPRVTEGANYRMQGYVVTDENYVYIEEGEIYGKVGEYHLSIFLEAVEGTSVFSEETGEYGEIVYGGSVSFNGKEHGDLYYEAEEDPKFLSVYIDFAVKGYIHDPNENPSAMKDIVADETAVYGFRPSETGSLSVYADADWTDPELVGGGRQERKEYHESLNSMYELLDELTAEGKSVEEIARQISTLRNNIRLDAYSDDPDGLETIKRRNLEKYGHEEGPLPDELFEEYGSWEKVISKAFSTNSGMDACLGLYDDYYDLYVAVGQIAG